MRRTVTNDDNSQAGRYQCQKCGSDNTVLIPDERYFLFQGSPDWVNPLDHEALLRLANKLGRTPPWNRSGPRMGPHTLICRQCGGIGKLSFL
jgi:hypothetical protein